MAKMKALVCRECGKEYPTKAIHVCEMCFGPLEVKYNYAEVKQIISRKKIEEGPWSMTDTVFRPALLAILSTPILSVSRSKNLPARDQYRIPDTRTRSRLAAIEFRF